MPRSHKGYRCILYIIDDVTNFLITVPIFQAGSEEVGALIESVITKYCIPEYIIQVGPTWAIKWLSQIPH